MKSLSDALFNPADIEQSIGSGAKTGLTFIPTWTCFGGPICDRDEDVD